MGAKCGATLILLRRKLNRHDRVSRDDIQPSWFVLNVKSYDCSAIAHRVSIFEVSCIEYK